MRQNSLCLIPIPENTPNPNIRISISTMDARPVSFSPEGQLPLNKEESLRLLLQTGLSLARERRLEAIVQSTLEAGLQLSRAQIGACLYTARTSAGREEVTVVFSDKPLVAASAASHLSLEILAETFAGEGPFRSGGAAQSPSDKLAALCSKLFDHAETHSYLAAPIQNSTGGIQGALLYAHADHDVFTAESESLLSTLTAQTAAAFDNAHLSEERKREAEGAGVARASQQSTADRLEHVLEATTDGVALLDRQWRFAYINKYANQIMAPGQNLIGTSIWEVFPSDIDGPFHKRYRRAMEHEEAAEFTEFYAPLKMWIEVRVFPTPEGIAIFFQDVTQQHEAEHERAETKKRLQQALDAGQLGTWSWSRDTDMLDLDDRAAAILNSEAHVPVARSALRESILMRDDLPAAPENFDELLRSGSAYETEYRIQIPNGQRWVSTRGLATMAGDDRTITGMTGTVQDVTAQKNQEAMLRQTEKLAATGRMAATIAHEINNPLEAVTNLIYLSKTDPTLPGNIQHLLELADTELARVSQIAQQTLGFYRDTTHPVDIDLSGLLHGVADLFSRKLHSRNLRIDVDVKENLHIFGLQGEVRQVFSNLMVNAIDASSKGTIRVRARPRSLSGIDGVAVMICDEGGGIPNHIRSKMFTPFFTTKQSVGTGLGLWVTRGIVEKSGGRVGFRSRTDPPTGTVFRVFFPSGAEKNESASPLKTTILQ